MADRGKVTEIMLRIEYPDGRVKHMTIPVKDVDKIVFEGTNTEIVLDHGLIEQGLTTKKHQTSWNHEDPEKKPTFLVKAGTKALLMCPPHGSHFWSDVEGA